LRPDFRVIDAASLIRQTALDGGIQFNEGDPAMVVDIDIRERLSRYCSVTKLNQQSAANKALRLLLEQAEQDQVLKAKMDRVAEIKAEWASL